MAFMTFSVGIYLDAHFSSNSPKIAQTQTGQVYQTSLHHGAVVYLTKQELFLLQAVNPTGIGCILLAIILNPPKLMRRGEWNP